MNELLLCKDCKHSFRTPMDLFLLGFKSPHAYKCRLTFKESAPVSDPVVGVKIKPSHYESCTVARLDYLSESRKNSNCGPNAQWWQPRNPKGLFKLILKESK